MEKIRVSMCALACCLFGSVIIAQETEENEPYVMVLEAEQEIPDIQYIITCISSGGTLASEQELSKEGDHRLTLRIPKWLMDKIDIKRKERVGKISRNLWILEAMEKATSRD